MRTLARFLTLALVLAFSPTLSAQTGLAGLLLALQQVRSNLDGVVNTVDTETAARIHQMEVVLDGTIAKLRDAVDHGIDKGETAGQRLIGDAADVLSQTQGFLQESGYMAFLGVNSSLVNAARVMDGLPLTKVSTFVFAVDPYRIRPGSPDRLVSVYGHFPDIDAKHPVTATLSGKTLTLREFTGNRVAFDLPLEELSREERFVVIDLSVPTKRFFGLIRGTKTIATRLYVERREPYSFEVTVNVENPEQWAVLPGSTRTETADSNRTSNVQTLTAQELFSTMINDNVAYDMATATFDHLDTSVDQGHSPGCNCPSSTAALTSWNPSSLSFALAAPTCPAHWVGGLIGGYWCGGGGSHSAISIKPHFRVKRRGVPTETAGSHLQIALARHSTTPPQQIPGWTSLDVVGRFRDGTERLDRTVRVVPGVPVAVTPYWTASINGPNFVINTR